MSTELTFQMFPAGHRKRHRVTYATNTGRIGSFTFHFDSLKYNTPYSQALSIAKNICAGRNSKLTGFRCYRDRAGEKREVKTRATATA
jgi:hypothetical protein